MELNSKMNETWKYRAFWGLAVCFILLLFLNQNDKKLSFLTSLSNFQSQYPSYSMISPFKDKPTTSNSTINHQSIQNNVTNPLKNKTNTSNSTIHHQNIQNNLTNPLKKKPNTYNSTINHKNIQNIVTNPLMKKPNTSNSTINGENIALEERNNYTSNSAINPLQEEETSSYNSVNENVTIIHAEDEPRNPTKGRCNIFEGKWVYKPEQEPSYNTTRCPFIEEKFSCRKNGRPDFEYERWRWQPNDCDIPMFNGTYMLERLRNKRLIIVGDSINRNQWESLACLLYASISPSTAYVDAAGSSYKVIKAKEYNCTVEFFWSPFLVQLNNNDESESRVLVLDKLSVNAKQWEGADVMVFNSGHWWTHPGKLKSWDVFQYKGELVKEMPLELAYKQGMTTWATWLKSNVDPTRTAVFFRSVSAVHFGKQWCYNSTRPITDVSYPIHFPKSLLNVIEGVVGEPNTLNVKYLNITKLSQYRSDAHPSMYRSTQWKNGSFPTEYVDCSHWCLPGLPDTWNRLLYASLFYAQNYSYRS